MKKHLLSTTLILDALALLAVSLIAYAIRAAWGDELQPFTFYLPLFAASIAIFMFCGFATSLYDDSRTIFSLSYVSDFLRAYALWAFFLIALPFFIKIQYSRAIILFILIASFIALYMYRIGTLFFVHQERQQQEVLEAVKDVGRLLQVSPDPLALLNGMRMSRRNVISAAAKRGVDIAGSLVAGIPALILIPIITFCIRRDSPGPAFIAQTRIGKNGVPFTMFKFRTMYTNVAFYAMAPRGEDDPRVTKVGKVLRKYSLDEIPQIWNVLTGTMSLVGPRPEMPFIVETYETWQRARLQVTPGITGLWQIFGRKDIPLEENLEYDLYYVFNQSFFLDCAIMLQTIPHLIAPVGAY